MLKIRHWYERPSIGRIQGVHSEFGGDSRFKKLLYISLIILRINHLDKDGNNIKHLDVDKKLVIYN